MSGPPAGSDRSKPPVGPDAAECSWSAAELAQRAGVCGTLSSVSRVLRLVSYEVADDYVGVYDDPTDGQRRRRCRRS
jgi:hypothetical protein